MQMSLVDSPAFDTCIILKPSYVVFHNMTSIEASGKFYQTMKTFEVEYNEDHYYWKYIGPNHKDLLVLQQVSPMPLCLTINAKNEPGAWVGVVHEIKRLRFFKTPFQVFLTMSGKEKGVVLTINPGEIFTGISVDYVVYQDDTKVSDLVIEACELLTAQPEYDLWAILEDDPANDPMPE